MTVYSAESFFRAKISQPILKATACPITVRISKLPTLTNWLLTISPNTENEEIVEYNNPQAGTMTIDIIKRGIKPDSILLTTNWVDYNNTTYQFLHTQNDIIRGDVNHVHINQGIGNSTLATNTWVGISKLSVAAVDAGDPIVVGKNDYSSTSNLWITKLSTAPASAANPIAVGDNDSRLSTTVVSANGMAWTVNSSNDITLSTTVTWVLKGNGTAISAATEGTDYYKPAWTDVVVADGWTGRSSHTAYAPIFWGTTWTWAQQSWTVGNIWEVLTSNWAWAIPTFQPSIRWRTTAVNLLPLPAAPSTSGSSTTTYGTTVTYDWGLVIWWINGVVSGSDGTWTLWVQYSPDNSNWTTIMSASAYATSYNNFSAPVVSTVEWALIAAWYIRTFATATSVHWCNVTIWMQWRY